jgi:uncharacterized protein YdaU (DUF1376 family)
MSRAWMPLYIADYLADTTHLDCAESGAYLHLIMHYWQHGALPNDDRKLRAIAKAMPRHWTKIRPVILTFFDANLKHKRIDQELRKLAHMSAQQSEKANKRWSRGIANGYAGDDAKGHAGTMPARVRHNHNHIDKDSLYGLRQEKGRETSELVFVNEDTEQWNAWVMFYRDLKKPSPGAISRQGTNERGWYFPAEWPPAPA